MPIILSCSLEVEHKSCCYEPSRSLPSFPFFPTVGTYAFMQSCFMLIAPPFALRTLEIRNHRKSPVAQLGDPSINIRHLLYLHLRISSSLEFLIIIWTRFLRPYIERHSGFWPLPFPSFPLTKWMRNSYLLWLKKFVPVAEPVGLKLETLDWSSNCALHRTFTSVVFSLALGFIRWRTRKLLNATKIKTRERLDNATFMFDPRVLWLIHLRTNLDEKIHRPKLIKVNQRFIRVRIESRLLSMGWTSMHRSPVKTKF